MSNHIESPIPEQHPASVRIWHNARHSHALLSSEVEIIRIEEAQALAHGSGSLGGNIAVSRLMTRLTAGIAKGVVSVMHPEYVSGELAHYDVSMPTS